MASHESLPEAALGRSSSMDARDALSRSDSQRRTAARRSHRAGNDLFVCFAARTSLNLVSRPVLSPSRDKGKDAGRRGRALSSSIFSKAGKKQGFEVEEPTSPKVTCIGQVRLKDKKKSKPWTSGLQDADALRKGKQRRLKSSSESLSLGRTEPNAASVSKKEKNSSSSACSRFGKDFSCFTLPCDSYSSLPSLRGNKKGCGTVFAKSLVLIQETDGQRTSKGNADEPSAAQTSGSFGIRRDDQKTIPDRQEIENSPPADVHVHEEDEFAIPPEFATAEATSSIPDHNPIPQDREEAVSETEEEETDTFEPEPPPPNALLLMRRKSSRLRVIVPPPSVNIVLKRSTSAPAQCRVRRSTKRDGEECETDLESGKENGHMEEKSFKERMSAEDLPKRNSISCAQKSFLKRSKSVSQSLTRSNGLEEFLFPQHTAASAEKESSPETVPQDLKPASSEATSFEVEDHGTTSECSVSNSRRRSEPESLKISLDVVPETWLWENCSVGRSHKDSLTQGKERGRGTEWLDTELEASLWKSCRMAEPLNKDTKSTCQETRSSDAEMQPDQCCKEHKDSEEHIKKEHGRMESGTVVEERMGAVISKRESTEVEEQKQNEDQGSTEEYSDSSSQDSEVEANNSEELPTVSQCAMEIHSICIVQDADAEAGQKLCSIDNQQTADTEKKIDEQKALMQKDRLETLNFPLDRDEMLKNQLLETADCYPYAEETAKPQQVQRLDFCSDEGNEEQQQQEKLLHELKTEQSSQEPVAPAPSPAPASITAPFQAPATTDALLFLRYNLGALRISLDGSDLNSDAEKLSMESGEQQHKVMLRAMSHFHEVGTCARLLKAASGREPGSLSSVLRLQRCKSEPVRLTS